MSTLDEAYLDGLVGYLTQQYALDPPTQGELGLIRFGKLQEDPTTYPAVALLRYGDPDDPTWTHEMIQVQGDVMGSPGNWGTGLWGRLMEMGGGTHWWHRYSCELKRYRLDTADSRFTAMADGMALGWWLAGQINAAQPLALALGSVGGQDLMQTLVTRLRPREGGGPDNYIWKITIQIQGLVHHAS